MSDYVQFEGKTIDDAISLACQHFNAERDQLEIEIISDSKGGIFGLVGAKKASIQAKLRDNSGKLKAMITTVVERLVSPIIQYPDIEVTIEGEGRARVHINDDENSGLLIGREGQTLTAVQYLANRMIATKWPEPVKIQIDTGDYRERQDDNLRQIALHMADRAKSQGKPQSTKPLSSYHRRLVHLALQEDPEVSTRSKGEGPLKRVIILPKRSKGSQPRDGKRGRSQRED